MSEPTIRELLSALDDAVEPPTEFAIRLRERIAVELRSNPTLPDSSNHDLEVTEVTLSENEDRGPSNRSRWMYAAAAAVVLAVAIGGVAVARSGDSSDESTIAVEPPESTDPPHEDVDDGTQSTPNVALGSDGSPTFSGEQLETFGGFEGEHPPYRIAIDDNVWLMSLDGEITRRDRSTLDVTARITVPESSMITAGGGAVWVADAVNGDVLKIDPTSAEVTATIPTGIVIDQDVHRVGDTGMLSGGRRQFARIAGITFGGGSVWVCDQDGRVLRIDPTTDAVVDEIAVSIRPDLVRTDGDHLLVGDFGSDTAVVIDLASGEELHRLEAGRHLLGGALHDGAAYIQEGREGVVTRVDITSGDQVQSEALGKAFGNFELPIFTPGPVVSDNGVVAASAKTFSILDERTLEVIDQFDLDGNAGEMTMGPDGDAWIVRWSSRNVFRIPAVPR